MFGSVVNHFEVRLAGVQYVREHSEQFIECVQEQSWSDYLSTMCRHGAWFDAAIVQGVADAYNLRVNIVTSAPGFCQGTVIEPHHLYQPCRSIFLGHVGEYHYVSTVPMLSCVISEGDYGRVIVSEQSRSNSCVSLKNSFYCGSELNGISSSSESSRRFNRTTYKQEYRRERNIDVIRDESVTRLCYHDDRKRKKAIIFDSICKNIGKRRQAMLN